MSDNGECNEWCIDGWGDHHLYTSGPPPDYGWYKKEYRTVPNDPTHRIVVLANDCIKCGCWQVRNMYEKVPAGGSSRKSKRFNRKTRANRKARR